MLQKAFKKLTKKNKRESMKLSDEQIGALVGMLLSDGHIERRSPTSNSRFFIFSSC